MLKVYNSLGRELQEFRPLREGFVGVYVCGPTVYGHSHIGHAKSYVSFDVIIRYLRHLGYRVRYVQNITDVGHLTDDADMGEDKIGRRARELGVQPMEVAEEFTRSYFEDMDALNVRRPDISPRASGHVIEQIELVKLLLERGHAYEAGGNVYFDARSWPAYGRLSGRTLDEMIEGERLESREEKRHPADWALWKRAEEGHIMRWPSPWGEGFPGWHLECNVMAAKYIGETLDIHGGGIENIFPHHEDEVAQAEAATGKPFVRYWLHNNMVTVNGQKMGKSLGNFILLKDAFAGRPPLEKPVRPMVIRYFVLTSHYRSPLDFSVQALDAAEKGLARIENTAHRVVSAFDRANDDRVSEEFAVLVKETQEEFTAEMDNDFNTAAAIGVLSTFTREVNRLLDTGAAATRGSLAAVAGVYGALANDVLGIKTARVVYQISPDNITQTTSISSPTVTVQTAGVPSEHVGTTGRVKTGGTDWKIPSVASVVDLTVEVRQMLREAKLFQLADLVRERLSKLSVEVKDGPEGPTWKFR